MTAGGRVCKLRPCSVGVTPTAHGRSKLGSAEQIACLSALGRSSVSVLRGTQRARTGVSSCRSSSFLDGDLDQQFESTKMSTGILSAHEPHKAVMIQAAISTFVRHLEGEKRDSSKN